jgi:cell division transport system permease protein
MAKGSRKLNSKAFAQQKRHRRQWVTFIRMCRYGINSLGRNAWLTIAATAIMTITLLVIFLSLVSRNVLVDTSSQISNDIKMSIYLKIATPVETVNNVADEVRALSSVKNVVIQSPDDAQNRIAQDNSADVGYLEAIKEMNSQLPWTINVQVADINDTQQLRDYVANSETVIENSSRPPTFAGERRATIDTIASAIGFAQAAGLIIGGVFVAISMLIIFNTIRMAIFNRREEIQMMKLIGAEKAFIRGPFLVEAMMYGFFAAVVADVSGYALLYAIAPTLIENDINLQPTLDLLIMYAGFVLLATIAVGATIGIISSLLATRRYLKI